ncbi:hypothetical protein L7F22_057670 [Adiantum nelumboides]|nr:hypothetical protein [Adiantum nelumboides]
MRRYLQCRVDVVGKHAEEASGGVLLLSQLRGLKLVDDSHHGGNACIEQQCWQAEEDGIVADRCQAAKHTNDEAGGSERALEELVPVISLLCKDGKHLGSVGGSARQKLQLWCEQGDGVLLALARNCIFKIETGCLGNLNMALVMADIPIGKLVYTRACGGHKARDGTEIIVIDACNIYNSLRW